MNIKVRRASHRGTAEHGWLHAKFSFSFANYHDPEHCGFHSLIVMNNDIIEPGGGFPNHPHKAAEIFTYVISGELEHRDSMGNRSIIRAGNLQYMSAGSGVTHSECNPSKQNRTELYQIWMLPNKLDGEPFYAEKDLADTNYKTGWTLLFSGNGAKGSTVIRQNAQFWFGRGQANNSLTIEPDHLLPNAWIQVISGSVHTQNYSLNKADGLGIDELEKSITLTFSEPSTFFLFRLAPL